MTAKRLDRESLRRAALAMLGRRDCSERVLAERLARRAACAEDVPAVIRALRQAGWIDEARACAFRAHALRERGWSLARIESTLEAEGYPPDARTSALGNLGGEPRGSTAASDSATVRDVIAASPAVPPRTLYRRLVARGFDPEVVAEALACHPASGD